MYKLHMFWPDRPPRSIECKDEPDFQEVKHHLGVTDPHFYFEMVPVMHEGEQRRMLVDEDGIRKKLPFNADASNIAGRPIVGPAAIWTGEWS